MTQVIYIDVLIIINIYIGYALLRLTGIICSVRIQRLRILASSVLQGLYSLVILLPAVSVFIRIPVRLAICGLFIAVAFKIYSKKEFIRLYFIFLALSFGFAGIMMALWLMKSPYGMSYNNGAVYFTIDAFTLAVTTVICYAVSRLIYSLIKRRSPKGSIYTLTINTGLQSITCRALFDSGNSLCDAFSGLPVIIIDEKTALEILPDIHNMETLSSLPGFRLIPCFTVNSQSTIPAFRPQSIEIESVCVKHSTDAVYIGIADTKISGGEFGALIGPRVLENASERRTPQDDKVFVGKFGYKKNNK